MKEESGGEIDTREILSRNPLFSGLEDFYLKDLLSVGEVRRITKDTQVISEGDAGAAVYFILSGSAKVTLYGEEGRGIVLSVLGLGDIFGEMAVIDGKPCSANVEASTPLDCFVVRRDDFLNYLAKHHRVYSRLFAYLMGRLRDATHKIGGLALLDVCGRLAHTLIGMSRSKGPVRDKVIAVERLTHEELAAMIGSSREVVSRAIKKMTDEGYIKVEKDRILLYMRG